MKKGYWPTFGPPQTADICRLRSIVSLRRLHSGFGIFLLFRSADRLNPKNSAITALFIALVFITLNQPIFTNIRQLDEFDNLIDFYWIAKTWIHPTGNWLSRFYEPGLALLGFICLILIFQFARDSRNISRLRTAVLVGGISICAWSTISYQWIGTTALFVSAIVVAQSRTHSRRNLLIGLLAVQILVSLTWISTGFPDSERVARLGGVEGRIPNTELIIIHVVLIAVAWLTRRRSVTSVAGPMVLGSACAVIATTLIINTTVSHWHFIFVPAIAAIAWWVDSTMRLLDWISTKSNIKVSVKHAILVGSIAIVGLGLYHLSHVNSPYFFVTDEIRDNVERTVVSCEHGDVQVHSRDPGVWWEFSGRTNCENPVSDGLSDKTNAEIADDYISSMLEAGVHTNESLAAEISIMVEGLASPNRSKVRDMTRYTEDDRVENHAIWWLFNIWMNKPENREDIELLLNQTLEAYDTN